MAKVKLDKRNYRKHPKRNKELINKSLTELGAGRSILIDADNTAIAGNGVLEQADVLGMPVRIVETDGSELIAIKRTDIKPGSAKRKKMALADNSIGETSAFDNDLLLEDFKLEELKEWGASVPSKGESTEDGFEGKRPKKPITKPGDIYELNAHRFQCGDSTAKEVVEKTLAGAKPLVMVTDPPYGVNYDPEWRHKAGVINSSRRGKVKNDDRVDWSQAYALSHCVIAYVWHGGRHAKEVAQNLEDCGYDIVAQIIWNKQQMVFGRGDYHWKHEPCWYAVKKGEKHNYCGDRSQTTVWDITSILQASKQGEANAAQVHGTQKPVECMARPIRNNSFEGQAVYDPFLGTGTTIIAADQLNRVCYAQEIDPGYCDMTVARYVRYKRSQGEGALVVKRNGVVLTERQIQAYLAKV